MLRSLSLFGLVAFTSTLVACSSAEDGADVTSAGAQAISTSAARASADVCTAPTSGGADILPLLAELDALDAPPSISVVPHVEPEGTSDVVVQTPTPDFTPTIDVDVAVVVDAGVPVPSDLDLGPATPGTPGTIDASAPVFETRIKDYPSTLPDPKKACTGDCTTWVCLYKVRDEKEDKPQCEALLKEKVKAPDVGIVRPRPENDEERKKLAEELQKSTCKSVLVVSAGHGMGTSALCTTANVCSSAVVSVGGTLHFIELGCAGLPIVDQKDAICKQLSLPAGCMLEANQLWSYGEPIGGKCNSRVVITGTAKGDPVITTRECSAMNVCVNPGAKAKCTDASKKEVTKTCCLDPRESSGAKFEDTCNAWYCKDVLGKARCYGGAAEVTQTCWENEKDKIDLACCGDDGKPAGFGKPGTYCKTK